MTMIEVAEFVTLEHIPVLETGIEYPASTGPFTPTSDMLSEVLAAQADPHVQSPRIKIAHADNPINDDLQALFDQVNAARDASEPSLGTIMNMTVENYGQTLYGDFYGLPAWLAAILETAYPARSIEGGAWKNTANDKEYGFLLEAVSLLGVVTPGCTSLADLQVLFSAEGPKITVIEMSSNVKAARGAVHMDPVQAQANVYDVSRDFYDEFAQGDRYWWWIREHLINPSELIVEDPDENQLYRLPYTLVSQGADEPDRVEFGDPEPIKIKYVPDVKAAGAARLIAPQLERAGVVLAVNHKPPRAEERARKDREESTDMSIDISALRTALNVGDDVLPEDATEEQINAALAAGRQDDPPAGDPPADPDAADAVLPEAAPEGAPGAEEPGSVEAERGVTMDVDAAAQLKSDAAMGREAREKQLETERKGIVDDAVKAGKFPPKARDSYLAQLERGGEIEKSTRDFIEKLEANTVPVDELGAADTETDQSDHDAIMSGAFGITKEA